jgi:DNA-binding LytR/AlgR family response regulator
MKTDQKIIIIEDEARAVKKLVAYLKEIAPTFTIVGTFETVRDSITFLSNNKVDLILSDIQLADGISFEIFEAVHVSCPIIFTTAYDEYAIKAFETQGIDYLLKPIQKERLEKAFEKFEDLKPSVDFESLKNLLQPQSQQFKKRFMVKVGEKIKSFSTDDIKSFYSLDKGTFLLTNEGRNYVVDYSLEEVNQLLDPDLFFRINRKIIVNMNGIDEIIQHSNSRLKLVISHLDLDEVIVARERVMDFKNWMGA